MKPKILAFGHKSRTGKDTATKILIDHVNNKYPDIKIERRAFADAVKNVSYTLYGCQGLKSREYCDKHPEARSEIIPALGMDTVEVWVAVGNKMRDVYPATWIDIALLDCKADIVIISDLRYPNEADRIHQLGGACVKMERKAAAIRDTVADKALDDYTSWDKIMQNDSTTDALKQQLVSYFGELGWVYNIIAV